MSYTFNLNTSYHPRIPYDKDIAGLEDQYICFVGEEDELMEADEFKHIMRGDKVKIIGKEKHLSIVVNQDIMQAIAEWMNKP